MKTIIIDGVEYSITPICKSTESEVMYNDWRLPTIQELLTLVNYNKYNPACDLEDTQCNFYWSSSPFAPDSRNAWSVHFGEGVDYWEGKSRFHLVRCVRDGENGLEWSASSEKSMTWNEAMEYAKNLIAPVYYKG